MIPKIQARSASQDRLLEGRAYVSDVDAFYQIVNANVKQPSTLIDQVKQWTQQDADAWWLEHPDSIPRVDPDASLTTALSKK